MARQMSRWSLEMLGSMTGFSHYGESLAVNSPSVLEKVLRRDRGVVTLVLVTVMAASWLYLLAGAGTGMYPHEMAMFVPAHTSMAGMFMSPVTWTPGYALLMFSMWWFMMIAMMLPSAAPSHAVWWGHCRPCR